MAPKAMRRNQYGWDFQVRGARQTTTDPHGMYGVFRAGLMRVGSQALWGTVMPELIIWLLMYYSIFGVLTYQRAHSLVNGTGSGYGPERKIMQLPLEVFCNYALSFVNYIPLAFILSYYLGICYTRWWDQYNAVPWPGKIGVVLRDFDNRDDEDGLRNRVTFMRWLLLGIAVNFQYCSHRFRKRHPGTRALVEAGLCTPKEATMLDKSEYSTELCWLWCNELLRSQEAKHPERMSWDKRTLKLLVCDWRTGAATMRGFEYATIPVALSQTMAFAVYAYFFAMLFGAQYIQFDEDGNESLYWNVLPQYFCPFFTILQFILYVGMFKVTTMLYNPYDAAGAQFDLHEYLFTWMVIQAQQATDFVQEGMYPGVDSDCPLTMPLPMLQDGLEDWTYGYDMNARRPGTGVQVGSIGSSATASGAHADGTGVRNRSRQRGDKGLVVAVGGSINGSGAEEIQPLI